MTDTSLAGRQSEQTELAELDNFADLLDSRFRIPGTNIRFGLDGIIGLVPGIGDAVTLAPMAYLLYKAHKMGARRSTMARMAANTGVDFVIGGIPVLGDAFDIWFKANRRNVALLKEDLSAQNANVQKRG